MTKITIEVTDEEMERLDFLGIFDAEMAGKLYERITITSCEEGADK